MLSVQQGSEEEGIAVAMTKLCQWFGMARRTMYYRATRKRPRVRRSLPSRSNSCSKKSRGRQFRSGDYQDYLAANGLLCSISTVRHCGENAACEGVFGLLKRERIYRTTYPTLDAVRSDVFEYIERRHNPGMRQRREGN